jgi:SAM-dependent methyltransferase
MADDKLNLQDYWERRLSGNLGLTTVGHAGLGYAYNAWLYRARHRALKRALKAAGVKMQGAAVAEVGVGSGAYIPFWQAQGVARLTGLDVTQVSVDTLKTRYPQYAFHRCDIGGELPAGARRDHDAATAFDVLFHIVDDTAFARAIGNLAQLVRPGGCVLISDSLADRPWGPTQTEYHRTYQHYLVEMAKHGLQAVHVEPVFYTMTTTFAGSERLAKFTGHTTQVVARTAARPVTAWANHLTGAALYAADGALARSGERGPSLNILIAQKAGDATG